MDGLSLMHIWAALIGLSHLGERKGEGGRGGEGGGERGREREEEEEGERVPQSS